MNLAVTLLVAVSIASVVGTVLKQNQPYTDYVIKFGPFWFKVFEKLGLYDVYSSGWFLFILTFLIISTSVCLYRNTPTMWREMRHFRAHVQEASLRALSNRRQFSADITPEAAEESVRETLTKAGFRSRREDHPNGTVLAAKKGGFNRLGYVLTHLAIVVIGIGGLIDGKIDLKVRQLTGDLRIETRDIPVSQVPEASKLPPSNTSFRANVTIPEGSSASVAFINVKDGYLVQELPFRIKVKDFRIEHYPTGQPKSFESDVVLTAPDLKKPIEKTVRVNHPLEYDGYSIFQASFGDGGSKLDLEAWPLVSGAKPTELHTAVFDKRKLKIGDAVRKLEITDFRLFNVRPNNDPKSDRKFRNIGPSFTFKLRKPSGEALEYKNYMIPVPIGGRAFYITGMRASPGDDFKYLHIPADPGGSGMDRFMALVAGLNNDAEVRSAASKAVDQVLAGMSIKDGKLTPQVAGTAVVLVHRLLHDGLDSVMQFISQRLDRRGMDPDHKKALAEFSRTVLQRTLWQVYVDVLHERADAKPVELSKRDEVFFQDAMVAITALPKYGAPVFLQLKNFKQIQAAGLQISRAPGKNVVYLGFFLLIAGVFVMFYVPYQRVWCWISREEGGSRMLLAGNSQRDPLGFGKTFAKLAERVERRLPSRAAKPDDE